METVIQQELDIYKETVTDKDSSSGRDKISLLAESEGRLNFKWRLQRIARDGQKQKVSKPRPAVTSLRTEERNRLSFKEKIT